jgi:DNA helicase-2/ATP-dependent DNA helicase PcrA
LYLLNNPQDEVAFLRVINTPARGIGKTTIERLRNHALNYGISMLESAREVKRIEGVSAKIGAKVLKFVEIFDRLERGGGTARQNAPGSFAELPMEELMGLLLTETGYRKQFESGDEEDQERLANIDELLTVAREFDERHGAGNMLDVFLEETALVGDTDGWETEADCVTLMTLHASKGLEFPVVFLVAVEEGLLPHQRSKNDMNELEEERRLMFVGITRAQQELQISHAKYRDFRGQRNMTVPSCFLMELPRTEMQLEFADKAPSYPVQGMASDGIDQHYDEPVYRREDVETGDNASLKETPLSPDAFAQGMKVEHPQYGIGEIIALSGAGPARQATVDFDAPTGRMRFMLAACPLRPAGC